MIMHFENAILNYNQRYLKRTIFTSKFATSYRSQSLWKIQEGKYDFTLVKFS